MSTHPPLIKLQPNMPCPCGSGIKTKKCWNRTGEGMHPPAVSTAAAHTGFAHPKCYMSGTEACNEKITKEHFISKCLYSPYDYEPFECSGAVFQNPGDVGKFRDRSFRASILCEKHNSALSPLDAAGKVLQEAMSRVTLNQLGAREHALSDRDHFVVNGHDLERFFVKTLCGILAAGATRFGGKKVAAGRAIDNLAYFLAEDDVLSPPHGLYVRAAHIGGQQDHNPYASDLGNRVLFAPSEWGEPEVLGLEMRIESFEFVMWTDFQCRPPRPDLEPLGYRPPFIGGMNDPQALLRLTWSGPFGNEIWYRATSPDDYPTRRRFGHDVPKPDWEKP